MPTDAVTSIRAANNSITLNAVPFFIIYCTSDLLLTRTKMHWPYLRPILMQMSYESDLRVMTIKAARMAEKGRLHKKVKKDDIRQQWCGVRDSNPRTPARRDLKSRAFGQLGKPRCSEIFDFLAAYRLATVFTTASTIVSSDATIRTFPTPKKESCHLNGHNLKTVQLYTERFKGQTMCYM